MKILNNYLENDTIKKGLLLNVSDWILIPCRKAFNGKNIQVIIKGKDISIKETPEKAPVGIKKILWTILAVATIPLASVAAFFKLCISPSIGTWKKPFEIGDKDHLLNDLEEVANTLKPLKRAGLTGRVKVYLALTKEQQNLINYKASHSVIEDIQKAKLTGISNVNVRAVDDKTGKFALLDCYLA